MRLDLAGTVANFSATTSSLLGARHSDLGEEELEELRMLSGFSVNEIHRIRNEFHIWCGQDRSDLTREEFLMIPVVSAPIQNVPLGFSGSQYRQ
jgi:hypothetical protein